MREKTFKILLTPGDGIGSEVITEAIKVLQAMGKRFGHRFDFQEEAIGGVAIGRYGTALREECLNMAKASDAVLFGAVGDPRYDDPKGKVRPEQAILGLRRGLGLFANIRPVKLFDALLDASPIRPEIVRGTDIVVIRELTGGIYFGQPQHRWESEAGRHAVDTMTYSEHEVVRIVHVAFELASKRRRKVTSVDKANILETSRHWREIADEIAPHYPEVELEHMLVDACAMHLINRPTQFDVVVTENMFGDILTDEAATLAGSMGMMPSASIGDGNDDGTGLGMYEPIHGSAPDIAGKGIANPLGTILSAAMMLRLSLGLSEEADIIERAVEEVLEDGHRTADLVRSGEHNCSTAQMGTLIAERVRG